MQREFVAGAVALTMAVAGCAPAGSPMNAPGSQALDRLAVDALQFAETQYLRTASTLDPARDGYPRSTEPDDTWDTVRIGDWTSGFFPGTLWYLYEHSENPQLRQQAERWTWPLADITKGRYNHDLGFQYFSSFGNAYRITGDERFKPPIMDAAQHLASRYSPTVGAIKSWDNPKWQYPVIIDNMMNLELLLWAADHGGKDEWEQIARRHATTTMQNHIRPDGGSFHVIGYDPRTGAVLQRNTHQGLRDESTWARGQAWGIYGFTMTYRETGDPKFLDAAKRLVDYVLPRLPADHVPCWDYQAPGCPGTAERDASAAAIMASALLELSQYVEGADRERYRTAAESILTSLATNYLARGTGAPSVLLHSVGNMPGGSEIDVGINYADYYFVEGLLRYLELRGLKERSVLPTVS